jgi:hypothetical protein
MAHRVSFSGFPSIFTHIIQTSFTNNEYPGRAKRQGFHIANISEFQAYQGQSQDETYS